MMTVQVSTLPTRRPVDADSLGEALRVREPSDDERDRPVQKRRGGAVQLEHQHQEQRERYVLGGVAVDADPAQEERVPAVPETDLRRPADGDDAKARTRISSPSNPA